jgi:hypothetical protein
MKQPGRRRAYPEAMQPQRAAAAFLAAGAIAVLAGCDRGEDPLPASPAQQNRAGAEAVAEPPTRPAPVECPPDPANCESAEGVVIALERRDPDGDGDAHLVLADSAGITAPGISVIDIRADLRPRPLPAPGDRVSAAGPVYEGSFGQRQIEAIEVRVARAPD